MKIERITRILRAAVLQAKENAKNAALVASDTCCVSVEISGVSARESRDALRSIQDDEVLMRGVRKIREHGPGKWTAEPYVGGRLS